MTLKEYKRQVDELSEAMAGFDGPEEEALSFLENLSQKYAEVSEFDIRAVECKNLEEFIVEQLENAQLKGYQKSREVAEFYTNVNSVFSSCLTMHFRRCVRI